MNRSLTISIALIAAAFGSVGCSDLLEIMPSSGPKDVDGVLESFKTDLGELSETYPELSGAGEMKVVSDPDGSSKTAAYTKNCKFTGKAGYKDTGMNACAVALRVMTGRRFSKDVREVAMPQPDHTWRNLKLVGWTTLHAGKKPSRGFKAAMQKLID